jgi:DNA-directed RNA polymerase specialized sigma24 family protein
MDPKASEQVWHAVLELAADLHAAMDKAKEDGTLSPMDVAVLFMYYWRDLTFLEIADVLKISVDSVRRRHKRALEAIRETGLLEGYDADD